MKKNYLATVLREVALDFSSNSKELDKIVVKLLDVRIFAELKDKPSLEELSIIFGVTRERIRQIERQAISHLRTHCENNSLLKNFIDSIDIYIREKQMENQ